MAAPIRICVVGRALTFAPRLCKRKKLSNHLILRTNTSFTYVPDTPPRDAGTAMLRDFLLRNPRYAAVVVVKFDYKPINDIELSLDHFAVCDFESVHMQHLFDALTDQCRKIVLPWFRFF